MIYQEVEKNPTNFQTYSSVAIYNSEFEFSDVIIRNASYYFRPSPQSALVLVKHNTLWQKYFSGKH